MSTSTKTRQATSVAARPASVSLDSDLSLDFLRVVEQAAIACAHTMGQGDRHKSDQVAVEAMRREMDTLPIDGTIVIGEGERDEAPMLYIGEKVGLGGAGERQRALPGDRHRRRSARGHEPLRHRRAERAGGARGVGAGRAAARARHLHGEAGRRSQLARCRRSRRAGAVQPARHRAVARPRRSRTWWSSCSIGRVTRS